MEYVTVKYPEDRDVYIDAQQGGKTNKPLMVNTGSHTFDLGNPRDYTPASQTVVVENTTPILPKEIKFAKAGAA